MKSPMNILQVNSAKNWGGIEHHVLLLSKGLRRRGHQVMIACSQGGILAEKAGKAGIPVVPIRMRGQWDLKAMIRLRQIMRQYRINVVNTHSPLSHTLAWLATARLGVRIVTARHTTNPIQRNPLFRIKWSYRVGGIIAASQSVADVLIASGIPAKRIVVIYCPIDSDRFHSGISGEAVREQFGVGADSPVIGQVGVLRSLKGFDDFIRTAALLLKERSDAHFLAVGAKTESYDELLQLARDLGVMDRFHFAGFRDDVQNCYAAMTVCVSSSTSREAAPYALKEPLAMGVPVVATHIGGHAEVVTQNHTGFLVPPRNPRAMADAVLRLLNDRDLRKRMGHQGQEDVKKRFSLDSAASRTEAVYQEALKED